MVVFNIELDAELKQEIRQALIERLDQIVDQEEFVVGGRKGIL